MWSVSVSNPRPLDCKPDTLPLCHRGHEMMPLNSFTVTILLLGTSGPHLAMDCNMVDHTHGADQQHQKSQHTRNQRRARNVSLLISYSLKILWEYFMSYLEEKFIAMPSTIQCLFVGIELKSLKWWVQNSVAFFFQLNCLEETLSNLM